MKKFDLMSGCFLVLLAMVLGFEAQRLAIWGRMGPREGFFPLILSVLIGCFGVIIALRAWLQASPREVPKIIGPRKAKLFVYVISFILFALALDHLGYTLSMTLYLVFILRFVERISWMSTAITVCCGVVISYMLFIKLLGIPLPEGVLTPAANLLREMGMRGIL